MNERDSAEVLAIKRQLAALPRDGSQWAAYMARYYRAQIRSARLREARRKGVHTEADWNAILVRYGFRCVICGCRPEGRPCKDHIVPIYLGGSDAADNLQPLCRQCNTAKGSDDFNWARYRDEFGFSDEQDEP